MYTSQNENLRQCPFSQEFAEHSLIVQFSAEGAQLLRLLSPDEHTGSGSVIDVPGDKKLKVSKGEKIRNRYNQVPPLTQDSYGKVTNSQLYTTGQLFPSSK